tara:strand:+ start:1239 stop:4214 length:2976 start_codon:yes stop_codon:yes gene_type:complete
MGDNNQNNGSPIPKEDHKTGVVFTMDSFANHTPNTVASLVAVAADNDRKLQKRRRLIFSDDHRSLLDDFDNIEQIAKNLPPDKTEQMKVSIAKKFVIARRSTGHVNIVGREYYNRDGSSPIKLPDSTSNSSQPMVNKTKKKSRVTTKNTPWKDGVEKQQFSTMVACKDHIQESYPTLFRRDGPIHTKEGYVTKYQCKTNLLEKKSKFGACRARICHQDKNASGVVEFQVAMNPQCACRSHCDNYVPRGLPPTMRQEVILLATADHGLQPQKIVDTLLTKVANRKSTEVTSSALCEINTCPMARKTFTTQVKSLIKNERSKQKRKSGVTKNVVYVADLVALKKQYMFDAPTAISETCTTESCVINLSNEMYRSSHLKVFATRGVTNIENNVHRMMTCLDPTQDPNDEGTSNEEIKLYSEIDKWRKESEAVEIMEGDPFALTTVFSSIGLLWNAKQCDMLEWKISCSADATDQTLSNNYVLCAFGCHSRDVWGTKSFRPFFYVLGPGERKIVFGIGMVAFLKYIRLLFNLKSIKIKGPCISDRCGVFVSVFSIAFPGCSLATCWVHIIRRFKRKKGNGAYLPDAPTHLKQYALETACDDVRQLHECITRPMFVTLSRLVLEAWNDKGLLKIAALFEKAYISNDQHNRWTVQTTDIYGCDSHQNPIESHNKSIKGTSMVDGVISPGKSIGTMLVDEFPNLIYAFTMNKLGVESAIKLQQEEVIFQSDSKIRNALMKYTNYFDPDVDCKTLEPEKNYNVTYLVNTEDSLGIPITDNRYVQYELALQGQTKFTKETRVDYSLLVASMCKVHGIKDEFDRMVYHGTCKDYCMTTYCCHAAYFQYNGRLQTAAKKIPTHRIKYKSVKTEWNGNNPLAHIAYKYMDVASLLDSIKSSLLKHTATNQSTRSNVELLYTVVDEISGIPDCNAMWKSKKQQANRRNSHKKMSTANCLYLMVLNLKDLIDNFISFSKSRANVGDVSDSIMKLSTDIKACINQM